MSSPSSHFKKLSWFGGLGALAVAALLLFLFDPEHVPIYPVCLFHKWTGLNCPGCGSLRALHALLHGEIFSALRFNALLVLSLPLFGWLGFRIFLQNVSGRPAVQLKPVWLWLYLGIWLAFGIMRDLPIPMFAALSP